MLAYFYRLPRTNLHVAPPRTVPLQFVYLHTVVSHPDPGRPDKYLDKYLRSCCSFAGSFDLTDLPVTCWSVRSWWVEPPIVARYRDIHLAPRYVRSCIGTGELFFNGCFMAYFNYAVYVCNGTFIVGAGPAIVRPGDVYWYLLRRLRIDHDIINDHSDTPARSDRSKAPLACPQILLCSRKLYAGILILYMYSRATSKAVWKEWYISAGWRTPVYFKFVGKHTRELRLLDVCGTSSDQISIMKKRGELMRCFQPAFLLLPARRIPSASMEWYCSHISSPTR